MLKTTRLTYEPGLALPVPSFDIATSAALLACVSWIYILNRNTPHPALIVQKRLKSRKRPRVDSSTLFPFGFYSSPDVYEIFKDNNRAGSNCIDNSPGDNVVTVFAEAVFFLREFSEVSLCRISAFRLESTFDSKIFLYGLFPLTFPKKVSVAGNGWTIDPEIDTCGLARRFDDRIVSGDDNVQEDSPISFEAKIRGTNLPRHVFLVIATNCQRYLNSPVDRCERSDSLIKSNSGGSGIISDCGGFPRWTRCLLAFLQFCFGRFKSLGGLHTSRANKLTRKGGYLSFFLIGKMVEFNSINPLRIPTFKTNPCKGLRKLYCSLFEYLQIFAFYWESQGYGLHLPSFIYSVRYLESKVKNYFKKGEAYSSAS